MCVVQKITKSRIESKLVKDWNSLQAIGNKREICIQVIRGTGYIECWASRLLYSYKWLDCTTRLTQALVQRKSGSALQHNETLAWSRKGNWVVDYNWQFKSREPRPKNETYRNGNLVYSILGWISWPFSSTFLTKSKVDRTDAAASVTIEWARCFPGQILPERRC